jgi:Flp pilus assembly pilin Flp
MTNLVNLINKFKDDTKGATMVEFMIILPLIFFWLAAGFVFFDVFSASIQSKRSTYTITDSISRQSSLNDAFIGRLHGVFQAMVDQDGNKAGVRVSTIRNTGLADYEVIWSVAEGRFDGVLYSGETSVGPDVTKINRYVPILDLEEEMVMVETYREYKPIFDWVGIKSRDLESVGIAYIRNSPVLGNDDHPEAGIEGEGTGEPDTGPSI